MPTYDCTVFAFAKGATHEVATFEFDHEDPTDPGLTFTFSPGRDGLAELRDKKLRKELDSDVARVVWEYVASRGGLVDPEVVDYEVSEGLKALTPGQAKSGVDLVFGSTSWGDIVLDRPQAEAWAETARVLGSGLTWGELRYRLPTKTRKAVLSDVEQWWLESFVEDGAMDEAPGDAMEDWSDAFSDESGTWPWLALDDHQADLSRLPESLRELVDDSMEFVDTGDGEYVYWEDADSLIAAMNEVGVRAVRDDQLIDVAMGPFGSVFGEAANDSVRRTGTEIHPLPAVDGEECPCCGTDQLIPIGYGLPDFTDGWPRDWFVGGCIVTPGQPTRACRACGLHLGPDGEWLRTTPADAPTPVTRRRLPSLEVGLTDLFRRATEAWGGSLGLHSGLVDLIPVGYTAGPWWHDVETRPSAGASARIWHYVKSETGDWRRDLGPEWEPGPGLVHVRSLEEPIGSILIHHPDGTTETIYGVDAFGLADEAWDRFRAQKS